MKSLSLLVTALCVTGNVASLLIKPDSPQAEIILPRGKGNDAFEEHKGSNRGGLNRDRAQPQRKVPHTEDDVRRARHVADQAKKVKVPDPKDWRRSSKPEEDTSAFTYDESTNMGDVYLGSALSVPSQQTRMRQKHDPSEVDYPYQPRPDNEEQKKEGGRQRRHAQGPLEKNKEIVLDHKGPMSGHLPKPGQVASVAFDNPASQRFEGNLFKQVNQRVAKNGYEDQNDVNSFKKGGVRVHPNTKDKTVGRPEIGPEDSKPYKYTTYEADNYQIHDRKRDRSDSGSDKSNSYSSRSQSQTIISKPPRKAGRHDPPKRKRQISRPRDLVGVGAIASTEATASTARPTAQNSTRQTPEELQEYLDAWIIVRDNATDILWPFLLDMLEGTNSSLVINAAWSVYAHMIPTHFDVRGPFSYGWTSLYAQEEEWAMSANISNATLTEMYAIDDVLLDLYGTAWDGGFQALNSSGLLDDLDHLTQVIQSYNASLPVSNLNPDGSDPYEDFFLSYYSIVPDDELGLNSTTSKNATAPYPTGILSTAKLGPTGTVLQRRLGAW